ncbi:MAG: hypothetical protein IJY36_00730 [Coprobacter sp.]|nr:hypothetical protein [Coprobacter sp.]
MESIDEKIREIKRQFRKAMNGIVAGSMHEKGVEYRVNFGLTLPLVKRIAAHFPPDKELATRLWNEQVRESKLLSTYLYPPTEVDRDTARRMIQESTYSEIADACCTNLFVNLAFAPELANECIASPHEMAKYIGYQLWNRLFINRYSPSVEESEALLSSVKQLLLEGVTLSVLTPVANAIKRLIQQNNSNTYLVKHILEDVLPQCPESSRPIVEELIDECNSNSF